MQRSQLGVQGKADGAFTEVVLMETENIFERYFGG